MSATASLKPSIVFATKKTTSRRQRFPKSWKVKRIDYELLLSRSTLASITVVEVRRQSDRPELVKVTRALANQQRKSGPAHFIVLSVPDAVYQRLQDRVELLQRFPMPQYVEITHSLTETQRSINTLLAKWRILKERMKTASSQEISADSAITSPRPSPLDNVRGIIEATRDLRVENGNLSVKAVAELFGLSLGDFSRWLGRTRQALAKTPDADSLQDALGYFERIARLRTVLEDDAAFRKWLRMPNSALGGKTALQFVEERRWQDLADFVDDILSGSPG